MNFKYFITTEEDFNIKGTRDLVQLRCSVCENMYTKTKKQALRSFKENKKGNMFCSSSCQMVLVKRESRQKFNCKNCDAEIFKLASEVKKSKTNNFFCNNACAATYNNKIIPKKVKTALCVKCNKLRYKTSTLCLEHFNEISEKKLSLRTQTKETTPSNQIRYLNRAWNTELITKNCIKCNYTRFVELAHIKAIKDFDEDTAVEVINHPSNIIPLCPTCHWEFDNGYREEFEDVLKEHYSKFD